MTVSAATAEKKEGEQSMSDLIYQTKYCIYTHGKCLTEF